MFNKKEYVKNKIKQYYNGKGKTVNQVQVYRQLAKNDIIYKILNNLSSRINTELQKRNIRRTLTYTEFLGCSPNDFKIFIENKFVERMNFDNYGEWVVDHIFPISKIDFNNFEEIKKCFHYTNLQPLWELSNRIKYNKINH